MLLNHRRTDRSGRSLRRRDFVKQAAVGAAATFIAPSIVRGRNLNDKLNVAIIGCGGRGAANLEGVAAEGENIVALCDVNQNNLGAAAAKYPRASKFTDFRRVFERAQEFDAVVVSTCEHTHAFATLPALQLGKHVYCEKPLTHNVYEARLVRRAAAQAKVATQMGTQIHAGDNYRRVVELVEAGAVGPVREVHVWVSRAWGRQSPEEAAKHGDIVSIQDRPTTGEPIPSWLDWDLWLGPAPERPFHGVYVPGPKWYRWWDFGNGTMSDLGSHWIDLPFWALKLDQPLSIEAEGPAPHAELAPASMQVTYEYGQRGSLPPVRLTWYQGTNKPAILGEGRIPAWDSGVLFVGDRGLLLSDYSKHALLPADQFVGFRPPDPSIPSSPGHYKEWLSACKTGAPTTCNFEYAGRLTEANHLGNVAFRAGKRLEWDSENLRVTNAPEANAWIRREYRQGWNLA